MNRIDKKLLRMVLMALFAALAYLAPLVIHIPYPAPSGKPFVHPGNMVVVLAALLLGGWQGGLSGAIGLGLYDITQGYIIEAPKNMLLKFGIGFFTGLVFSRGRKNDGGKPRIPLFIISAVSFCLGGIILAGKISGWAGFEKVSFVAYLFMFILGLLLLLIALLSFKYPFFDRELMYAAMGSVTGMAWNLVGYFSTKVLGLLIQGSEFNAAVTTSLLSMPASIINAGFSIVGAIILYQPLKRALVKAGLGRALE
ncbi:MAG TPA: ECF transporter S component [Candidatus Avimonas sp.]|nr:hypothetical protein [Clostridiales bacterium]HPU59097.1 ECF transporter S component [Candidatus Avimonas sp.]